MARNHKRREDTRRTAGACSRAGGGAGPLRSHVPVGRERERERERESERERTRQKERERTQRQDGRVATTRKNGPPPETRPSGCVP